MPTLGSLVGKPMVAPGCGTLTKTGLNISSGKYEPATVPHSAVLRIPTAVITHKRRVTTLSFYKVACDLTKSSSKASLACRGEIVCLERKSSVLADPIVIC